MFRLSTAILLCLSAITGLAGAEPSIVELWPSGAPEASEFQAQPESTFDKNDNIKRVTNVSRPTLAVYRPPNPNGTGVLVCPGGGFNHLSIENEGSRVCEWLNSLGVTAVLLKYRVPKRNPADPAREGLQDAQRAMGMIRQRAASWGIRPDRIGIMGFSAGGHLAVMVALHANRRTYPHDPAIEAADAAPNFSIPIYPAYLVAGAEDTSRLGPDIKVTPASPPMCLIHAHSDSGVTSSAGSALLYLEYKKLNLPAELHVFTLGGHGFGMKKNGYPSDNWTSRAAEWMQTMGLLPGPYSNPPPQRRK